MNTNQTEASLLAALYALQTAKQHALNSGAHELVTYIASQIRGLEWIIANASELPRLP